MTIDLSTLKGVAEWLRGCEGAVIVDGPVPIPVLERWKVAAATCEQAQAEIARLRAALEAVEWIETFDYHNGAFDYLCPWCYADGERVPGGDQHLLRHASDCPRQLALAGKE